VFRLIWGRMSGGGRVGQQAVPVRRLLGSLLGLLALLAALVLTAAALPTANSEGPAAPAPSVPAALGWGVDHSLPGDATVRIGRVPTACTGIGSHPAVEPVSPVPITPAACSHAPVRGTISQRTGESTAIPGRAPPAGDQPIF
jgi:hypothetical protein